MLLLPSPNQLSRINACIYQSYIDIYVFNIFQHLEELPDQIEVLPSKIYCPVTFLLMPASTNKWPKRFPKASLVAGQRPLKNKRSNSHGPLGIVYLLTLLDMLVDTCFVTVQNTRSNVQHVPGPSINTCCVWFRFNLYICGRKKSNAGRRSSHSTINLQSIPTFFRGW